ICGVRLSPSPCLLVSLSPCLLVCHRRRRYPALAGGRPAILGEGCAPAATLAGGRFMSSAELAVREPKSVVWTRRHLLGLEELGRAEIETILNTAEEFVEVSQRRRKKRSDLKGKVVVNLFFEPSTPPPTSFH